jgi:hypothetical protein
MKAVNIFTLMTLGDERKLICKVKCKLAQSIKHHNTKMYEGVQV